ncbi:hypothetical protein RHMOL_Rhmol03G0160300 [Rhododendron molle]|uniref:Uncharacterized protein n=1 Tax=Rhododendron molle TaxID=49168 RepID=A0ACC0PGG5_RHOML|nr:hypothetical protein RHMOL_Rhmol03G0160300 [Rhododendron molle]
MADGTISMAEGLGSKALDSNEIRRKQKNNSDPDVRRKQRGFNPQISSPNPFFLDSSTPSVSIPNRSSPTNSIHKPFDLCPGAPPLLDSFTNPTPSLISPDDSSHLHNSSSTIGAHSPKKSSPARELQVPGDRLESEERLSSLVRSLEAEMKSSGVLVDCTELKSQLNRLKEHHDLIGCQSSVSDASGKPQTLNVNFKIPSGSNFGQDEFINLDLKDGILPNPIKPHTNRHQNPIRPKGNPKNWASLFAAQGPSKMMKLDYYPLLQKGKCAVVELDESDIDEGSWNHCLIGHFLDGKMEFPLLKATARTVWKDDLLSVKELGSRFLFEFKDEAAKMRALEDGPHFFSRRFLVLQNWKRMMLPSKDQPSKIPAWIKILKLPLEFWTAECFSKIASTIGKPLHVDQATAKKLRLDYARICVEIDAGTDLPDDVQITINGETVIVALQYQWLPPICTDCKVFGHPKGTCSKQSGTKVSTQQDTWQVVSKGKGKRDANSTDMVSGESSSSQSAIEVSNGIPSVLVDLPNLDEVQPTTTSEVVPILASEIVVKDSVGIVVKGPVVHAPSNQANGGQMAACAQSIQGQVVTNEKLKLGELTSSQKNVLGLRAPPSPVLQQVLQEDSDDSEADLLEVLEGVVRSVINDPSNFQKATTSPTSIANNPTVITPSKQPTKAAKKASKAAWSDNRISQHVPNPDGDEKEPPDLLPDGKQRSHSKGSQKKRK